MSAFIVSESTIVALVIGYYRHSHRAPELDDDQQLTAMANLLWRENERSVAHLYRGDTMGGITPISVTYTMMSREPKRSVVQLLKLADCLEYQSCETDDYYQTEAYKLLERMRRVFIAALPGYDEASWGL